MKFFKDIKMNILALAVFLSLLLFSAQNAYSLLRDTAGLTLGLSTANFDPSGFLRILDNKPIVVEDVIPEDESDWGYVELLQNIYSPSKFYMYITETDGNVCSSVNIVIQSSDNENGPWETLYDGELEKIRGNNDRVELYSSDIESESTSSAQQDSIYIRQKVMFSADADKNDAGKECLWDEIFRSEFSKKEYVESTITRNILTATFWIIPEVEVKKPKNKESFVAEQNEQIKWKVKTHDKHEKEEVLIDIDLYDQSGANFVQNIATGVSNTGKLDWVPESSLIGDGYKIKITATDPYGLTNFDFSDEDFSIIAE